MTEESQKLTRSTAITDVARVTVISVMAVDRLT